MPSRTQLVCLHEGRTGSSIDPIFITRLIRQLQPAWLRPSPGGNVVRTVNGGGRTELIRRMPSELRQCLAQGGNTTLMVWADLDHDMPDGTSLKEVFWREAEAQQISREQFDEVVFAFAKDRIENWIEFLRTGSTDEATEGPRVPHGGQVREAADRLAERCRRGGAMDALPPSLGWSCTNWRSLVARMKP